MDSGSVLLENDVVVEELSFQTSGSGVQNQCKEYRIIDSRIIEIKHVYTSVVLWNRCLFGMIFCCC